MRIAVTYDFDSGNVFQHFGQTECFLLVEVDETKNIKSEMVVNTGRASHSALVPFLKDLEVDVLLCGGLGNHAINFLKEAGIRVYPGVIGKAREKVVDYLNDNLAFNPDVVHECDCHHH